MVRAAICREAEMAVQGVLRNLVGLLATGGTDVEDISGALAQVARG